MKPLCLLTLILSWTFIHSSQAASSANREESVKAFLEAAKVFKHPRCMNCHPAGEQPLQGIDMHTHMMNVQRGADNHGALGMKCASCHGQVNNQFSGVPGAPKWGLAPKELAWVGLNDAQLCRRLKSNKPGMMAGHMTTEEFIKHNAEDPLVAWGWNPGDGREPAPGTQAQFGQLVARWIETGAECPN
jgi:hypothetical protein